MGEHTVRLQVEGGIWETLGRDRYEGLLPDGVNVTSDPWGYATCNFNVPRDPILPQPDLSAFTPAEIYDEGRPIFEGRVQETPTRRGEENAIAVAGRGYQYHLDDDVLERYWVHSRLSDWIDMRTLSDADLSRDGTAAGTVEVSDQSIVFGWPKGTALGAATPGVGIALDMGSVPNEIKFFSYDILAPSRYGVSGAFVLYTRSSSQADMVSPSSGSYEDGQTRDLSLFSTTTAETRTNQPTGLTKARRYLGIVLFYFGGAVTTGEDNTVKITGIRLHRTLAEATDGVKASTVIGDLPAAFPLLNSDTSGITSTLFSLPDFAAKEPRTGREIGEGVNAFHRYQIKVLRERRLIFEPQKTVPKFLVGSWGNPNFDDASQNSGEEIYNRAIGIGTGGDGAPVRVERWAAQQPGVPWEAVAFPGFSNPGFETDLSGWTGDLVRTTTAGEIDNGVAAARLKGREYARTTPTGTFLRGVGYLVTFRARLPTGATTKPNEKLTVQLGVPGVDETTVEYAPPGQAYQTFTVAWVPAADRTGVELELKAPRITGVEYLLIDTFTVNISKAATIPDRRGFVRTKILTANGAMNAEALGQVCDVFLQAHMRTPLKGAATYGPGDIRDYLSGAEVHPRELVDAVGELIHFSHMTDPDTGSAGRDGVIAAVGSYSPETEQAQIAIDSQRDNLEALLARFNLISGGA